MRLSHFLAQAGVASRRASETIILHARVRVDGEVVRELGTQVDPSLHAIELLTDQKWQRISLPDETVCYALNKPAGYTSTVSDPHAEHTVLELVPKLPHVVPIGRLDKDTTGLLLLSNNGALVHALTHPSHHIAKTYRVVCNFPPRYKKELLQANIAKIAGGLVLDGEKTAPADIHITNSDWKTAKELHLKFVLHEGKNRQIRKSLQKIGLDVIQLERTAIGKLTLDSLSLAVGTSLQLSNEQLELLGFNV